MLCVACALCLALAVTAVILARQNRVLRSALSERSAELVVPRGKLVPPLVGIAAGGRPVVVGYDGHGLTAILAFDESCGYCDTDIRLWRSLASLDRREGGRVRLVAVDLQPKPAQSFLSAVSGTAIVVVTHVKPWCLEEYRLGAAGVPQILTVNGEGVVTGAWTGSITPAMAALIEEDLGLEPRETGAPGAGPEGMRDPGRGN